MLPYIAGLVAGDGHIEPASGRVVIASSDHGFAGFVAGKLLREGFSPSLFRDSSAGVWKIAVRSEKLRDALAGFNLSFGRKLSDDKAPEVDAEGIQEFIAGLYDAEGWFELDKEKYVRIRLKMKSKSLVEFIFRSLNRVGVRALFHEREDSFVVDINRRKDVEAFFHKFSLFHPKWLHCRKIVLGG